MDIRAPKAILVHKHPVTAGSTQTLKTSVAVIGVDIGKNSFHVVGQDRRGSALTRLDKLKDGKRITKYQQLLVLK